MKKSFFIPILFFLCLLLIAFLVLPKYRLLKDLKEELKVQNSNFQQEKAYFQKIEEAADKLKNYQDSLAKIEIALPPTPSLPTLLDYLQKVARQSGLLLSMMSPGAQAAVGQAPEGEQAPSLNLKKSGVALGLVGSYEGFKEYLRALERSARIIEVQSVSVEPGEEDGLLEFALQLTVYSY